MRRNRGRGSAGPRTPGTGPRPPTGRPTSARSRRRRSGAWSADATEPTPADRSGEQRPDQRSASLSSALARRLRSSETPGARLPPPAGDPLPPNAGGPGPGSRRARVRRRRRATPRLAGRELASQPGGVRLRLRCLVGAAGRDGPPSSTRVQRRRRSPAAGRAESTGADEPPISSSTVAASRVPAIASVVAVVAPPARSRIAADLRVSSFTS